MYKQTNGQNNYIHKIHTANTERQCERKTLTYHQSSLEQESDQAAVMVRLKLDRLQETQTQIKGF